MLGPLLGWYSQKGSGILPLHEQEVASPGMSEVVTHWDGVQPHVIEQGPLQGRRWRLGPLAGTDRVGLSRYAMGPGQRPMPLHTHADEEEIVFVLAGDGVTTDGERAWPLTAGDTVVHTAGGTPHTFVAGPGGMEVLVFGSGSDTHLTWLPRANVMWAGPRWLPLDGPHPFRAEVDAGPLVLGAPAPERPPHVAALDDVEPLEREDSDVAVVRRRVGAAAGATRSGLSHLTVAPGRRSSLPHCHSAEEELFVVLDGSGLLELHATDGAPAGAHPVARGSLVARPAGSAVAHSFVAGPDGLTLLAFSRTDAADTLFYPRSQKVMVRGLGVVFRIERTTLDDGEPGPSPTS